MVADHGSGVDEGARERLEKMLATQYQYMRGGTWQLGAVLVEMAGMLDEILHRLERIENGEKKTGNGTTPTCGNTGSGKNDLS